MKYLPNIVDLKNKFSYDQESGQFFVAGTDLPVTRYVQKNGYIALFFRRYLQAHRVAWLYMTGDDPYGFEIDHINGVTDDNRWVNLRKATKKENAKNLKMMKSNTSGFKGVSWNNGQKKWRAEIQCDNIKYQLGGFDDVKDAALAYEQAAEKLFNIFRRDAA